ncbi:hypothetical protein CL659_03335 [bacterium]|nr:hypothetical protein [bacterium]|tara:strand:- start:14443 stop:15708 length:1266 start_codon:yes stop_codon:yes gene_type:complete
MNFKNSLFVLFAVAFFAFVFGEDDPKWVENVNTSVQSTVTVTAGGGDYAGDKSGFVLGGGSGSIVTPEGHIVTNCHVMGWGKQRWAFIRLNDGSVEDAKLLFNNCKIDIAILQIVPEPGEEGKVFPYVKFGDSDEVVAGEQVYAIGNPGDSSNFTMYKDFLLKNTVTAGSVRDRVLSPQLVNRMLGGNGAIGGTSTVWDYGTELSHTFDTDATINGGNSGGPLFDENGFQVGVNFAGSSMLEGQNMAIVSNDAKKTLLDTIDHGRVVYPWLGLYVFIDRMTLEWSDEIGIQGRNPLGGGMGAFGGREAWDRASDTFARQARNQVKTPFEVFDVYPESPSYKAGLRQGDKILEIAWDMNDDGKITKSEMKMPKDAFEARFWIRSLDKNIKVILSVERNGQVFNVPVVLGEQPGEGQFAGGTL